MKRLITMIIATICSCSMMMAASTLTANVTRTVHKTAVKKDAVSKGTFDYKKGGNMSLTFSSTDKLLMQGSTYTIVSGKRKLVAKGEVQSLFSVLQDVVDDVLQGGNGNAATAKAKGVNISHTGNTITLTPTADTKKKKKLRFTSFAITIDAAKHHVKSIRMNGKGGNYTSYDLSNYK